MTTDSGHMGARATCEGTRYRRGGRPLFLLARRGGRLRSIGSLCEHVSVQIQNMREETMRKASAAAGLALACLLSTASIALAADPGTGDPNNWPQYNRTAN